MSTKEVQKDWNRKELKTSEGISKYNKVEYTLSVWIENFTDYLKSAMSYSGSRSLEEFIGEHDGLELVIMHIKDFINKKIPQLRDFFIYISLLLFSKCLFPKTEFYNCKFLLVFQLILLFHLIYQHIY